MTEEVAAIIRRARDENAEKLDLSNQGLSSLPREVCQLENLSELILEKNQLTTLPTEIGQLSKLRYLSLNENRLATFPSVILRLQDLERLGISNNQFDLLPPEVGQLGNLAGLTFENNQLTTLPIEIFELHKLRLLYAGGNPISSLPREIGRLRNLRLLSLSDNKLATLPDEIFSLHELDSLWLGDNQLEAIPREIKYLKNLSYLSVRNNRLTFVPPEIGRLKKLSSLTLGENQLTNLPEEIGQLQDLSELDLWRNEFTVVPREVFKLRNLKKLSLPFNKLTNLPSNIGELQSLTSLRLEYNKLSSVPPDIGLLRELETLQLGSNQLTSLPQELADIPTLKFLELEGNPWREPLASLVPQGLEAVLVYLRTLPQALKTYEAKVLLVGEGNVGKSSLVAALRSQPFTEGRDTTHGIEVSKLKVPHPREALEMTLNTWDFGGQEVYRITHQFFFSPRSLYLLVWNPREGRDDNAIEDWLKRIKLRVGDARVLIVATHADDRRAELDYAYLRQRFGGILVGNFEVDNKTGRGIDDLRVAIAEQAALLPQMGERLAPDWVSARDEVVRLGKSQPQVAYSEVEEICRNHGLDQAQTKALLILMHIVGYIIHYGEIEGLRDVVVLQPEWLTKAISYVLEDRPTIAARGELEHARLSAIWLDQRDPRRETYPVEYHPYFLRLMEKFDICYRLEAEDRSLVAQLVPVERPELPWQFDSGLRPNERELALFCRVEEDPPGLVAWLTVRNHRFTTGRHWRRGIFLEHQGHQALLQMNGQLFVSVRGPSPDYFFSLVRDSLEYLIQIRWPGLKYALQMPCPHREEGGSRCDGRFEFANLLRARERGIPSVQCNTCFETWSVSQLLTGFAPSADPISVKLDEFKNLLLESWQDQAHLLRMVMKAINAENRESPRLFSLFPLEQHRWDPRRLGQVQYKLHLWCEQPEHQHPAENGEYTITQSREWLVKIAPYASFVAKVLKLAVPLVGAVSDLALDEATAKAVQPEFKFMEKLTSELLRDELDVPRQPGESRPGLNEAQGSGLRELQSLLLELDPAQKWGDLRRVQNAAGDYLWVCPRHYREYDPGLPVLPGS